MTLVWVLSSVTFSKYMIFFAWKVSVIGAFLVRSYFNIGLHTDRSVFSPNAGKDGHKISQYGHFLCNISFSCQADKLIFFFFSIRNKLSWNIIKSKYYEKNGLNSFVIKMNSLSDLKYLQLYFLFCQEHLGTYRTLMTWSIKYGHLRSFQYSSWMSLSSNKTFLNFLVEVFSWNNLNIRLLLLIHISYSILGYKTTDEKELLLKPASVKS